MAEENPDAILKAYADPLTGLSEEQAREMAFKLGLGDNELSLSSGTKMFQDLYNVFMKYDGDMLEINPLIVEPSGKVVALDAKMTIDSNAFLPSSKSCLLRKMKVKRIHTKPKQKSITSTSSSWMETSAVW